MMTVLLLCSSGLVIDRIKDLTAQLKEELRSLSGPALFQVTREISEQIAAEAEEHGHIIGHVTAHDSPEIADKWMHRNKTNSKIGTNTTQSPAEARDLKNLSVLPSSTSFTVAPPVDSDSDKETHSQKEGKGDLFHNKDNDKRIQ